MMLPAAEMSKPRRNTRWGGKTAPASMPAEKISRPSRRADFLPRVSATEPKRGPAIPSADRADTASATAFNGTPRPRASVGKKGYTIRMADDITRRVRANIGSLTPKGADLVVVTNKIGDSWCPRLRRAWPCPGFLRGWILRTQHAGTAPPVLLRCARPVTTGPGVARDPSAGLPCRFWAEPTSASLPEVWKPQGFRRNRTCAASDQHHNGEDVGQGEQDLIWDLHPHTLDLELESIQEGEQQGRQQDPAGFPVAGNDDDDRQPASARGHVGEEPLDGSDGHERAAEAGPHPAKHHCQGSQAADVDAAHVPPAPPPAGRPPGCESASPSWCDTSQTI